MYFLSNIGVPLEGTTIVVVGIRGILEGFSGGVADEKEFSGGVTDGKVFSGGVADGTKGEGFSGGVTDGKVFSGGVTDGTMGEGFSGGVTDGKELSGGVADGTMGEGLSRGAAAVPVKPEKSPNVSDVFGWNEANSAHPLLVVLTWSLLDMGVSETTPISLVGTCVLLVDIIKGVDKG